MADFSYSTYMSNDKIYDNHIQGISKYERKVINETLYAMEEETGFPADLLIGRSRKTELVTARFICMVTIKRFSKMSLKNIGIVFGRDHSTVIHARDEVNYWMTVPGRYVSEMVTLQRVIDRVEYRMSEMSDMVSIVSKSEKSPESAE
jgi:chromosomal replication initiation ATPase DnaA